MDDSSPPTPFRQRLTVRLTAGVTLALLLIGVPFLLAFHRLRQRQHTEDLLAMSNDLAGIVVDSFHSTMLAGEPHLLDETVHKLARHPQVERVLVFDEAGELRHTSDTNSEATVSAKEREDFCKTCHNPDMAPLPSRTFVTHRGDHEVVRSVSVIRNERRCFECHDRTASTRGVLLLDLDLREAHLGFFAGIGNTVALGVVMVVLTIAVLILLLRKMVHEPLAAVVTTSRKIVDGDLQARVPIDAPGEFGFLATRLNRMTDHLAQSMRAVETHRRELEAVLDSVDDHIVVLDKDRRVVTTNHAFRASLGQTEADVTGRHCEEVSQLSAPCSAEASGCPLEKVFQTGELHKGIVSSIEPDGRERTIEIHASPLRGPDGSVQQVVEVRRDISERRQLDATLAHSERLSSLGLLASGLSHEINNPLGVIAMSVAGMERRLAGDEGWTREVVRSVKETLPRIAKEVERASAITGRLMRVARPPGNTRTLVDVNHVIEDCLALFSYQIELADIGVRKELGESLPVLAEDESRVGQILTNLILNAIQAMENDGGTLRVATSAEGTWVRIEVEDTGQGIPPEMLQRVFEPFFTTKPVGKGTGLGLFITDRIVADMGGSIELDSRLGKGTRSTVRLPTGRHRSSRG